MIVYLLRHGDAADVSSHGPRTDDERPLTQEGVEKLDQAARTYARIMEPVSRLLVSPLVRARQSAQILAKRLTYKVELEESSMLVPGARVDAILDLLRAEALEQARAICLVGHEPHLGTLAGALLTGSDRVAIPLRKGMLLGVRVDEPRVMMGSLAFSLSQKVGRELA